MVNSSTHSPQQLTSTSSYASTSSHQHQVIIYRFKLLSHKPSIPHIIIWMSNRNIIPIWFQQGMSTFQSHISKGKLRIINQEGIITNTAENIQTPSTADFSKPPPLNYKMTPCKLMPGEQVDFYFKFARLYFKIWKVCIDKRINLNNDFLLDLRHGQRPWWSAISSSEWQYIWRRTKLQSSDDVIGNSKWLSYTTNNVIKQSDRFSFVRSTSSLLRDLESNQHDGQQRHRRERRYYNGQPGIWDSFNSGKKILNFLCSNLICPFYIFEQNVSCLKDKSCSGPPQIDLTDMEDSNSWLVDGGVSHPRSGSHHHCGGETITEGSWTTPAEPSWIPEAITSREDGKKIIID